MFDWVKAGNKGEKSICLQSTRQYLMLHSCFHWPLLMVTHTLRTSQFTERSAIKHVLQRTHMTVHLNNFHVCLAITLPTPGPKQQASWHCCTSYDALLIFRITMSHSWMWFLHCKWHQPPQSIFEPQKQFS